jgi:hypothetical protein
MLGHYIVLLLILAGTVIGAFSYVKGIGYEQCKSEWFWELQQEAKDGEKIRTDSERDVARDVPDVVRRDPRNRDNWPKP